MAHILVGNDDRCTCDQGSSCVFGRSGCSQRCTTEELMEAGYRTVQLSRSTGLFTSRLFKAKFSKGQQPILNTRK